MCECADGRRWWVTFLMWGWDSNVRMCECVNVWMVAVC